MTEGAASGRPGRLFVYGTLRQGAAPNPARRRLEAGAELVGRARIRGRLFEVPSGSFPAAVPADDGWVIGDLYRLRHPEELLRALDRYEGRLPDGRGLFRREVVRARLLAGDEDARPDGLPAWAYFYARTPGGLRRVEGGDWLERGDR